MKADLDYIFLKLRLYDDWLNQGLVFFISRSPVFPIMFQEHKK